MLSRIGKKIIGIVLLISFILPFTVLGTEMPYIWAGEESSSVSANPVEEKEASGKNTLALESGSAILIEQSSGKVLYEHNMHEPLRPASVTKVMTILLIMEAIDEGKITYQDKIPCSENASGMGGSQIWLDPKEELTVDEMLKAICVVSANDCTVAMAEYLEGSQEAFVSKMNEKAQELGMKDTCFKNCHGIDEDGHITSSYDIALMSKELLTKHPDITKYTTIYMDSLRDGKSQLVNTNKLIRNYQGATGLKTGSTSLALYNLSASATRNGLSLIAVIMKAPTTKQRFAEAQKLLDYGFTKYSYKEFGKKGEAIGSIAIEKGVSQTVEVVLESDSGTLLPKGKDKSVVQELQMEENRKAPIEKNQKVGEVVYKLDGEIIGKSNIIAKEKVEKMNLITMCQNIFKKWFNLLRE